MTNTITTRLMLGESVYRYDAISNSVSRFEVEEILINNFGIIYKAMMYRNDQPMVIVDIDDKLINIVYFERKTDAENHKNILSSDDAYIAINKILDRSGMSSWCQICFCEDKFDSAYGFDIETGDILPFSNALNVIKEGMIEIDEYGLTDAEKSAFFETLIINGISI